MEISVIEQEMSDLDWFAIDLEYKIAHFSSAGGSLPRSVSISAEDNAVVTSYFQSLIELPTAFIINPHLQLPEEIKTPKQQSDYFRTYAFYSKCGLYSFARNETYVRGSDRNFDYKLITSPSNQRTFKDIPYNIQQALVRTKYTGLFNVSEKINLTEIS